MTLPWITLQHEIKNVVTVIAKTTHYWTAHMVARRRGIDRSSLASTALPRGERAIANAECTA